MIATITGLEQDMTCLTDAVSPMRKVQQMCDDVSPLHFTVQTHSIKQAMEVGQIYPSHLVVGHQCISGYFARYAQ